MTNGKSGRESVSQQVGETAPLFKLKGWERLRPDFELKCWERLRPVFELKGGAFFELKGGERTRL